MAPSLRDLIDFLLAEIALCGSQGASPADILSFINIFYDKSAKNGLNRTHVVDRRFQEQVWQWLTRNPEVSVGKNREGNHLSLQDAQDRQLETTATEEPAQDSHAIGIDTRPLRVFVSEERTWLAITGHEPDDTKVLPLEFALLSIIASRKSSGIAQPDLIRLSGQDKRSVPKRTDVLQQKGYIEKRAIQIKAARTSLCTLRKFVDAENHAAETPVAGISEVGTDGVKMIDFAAFTNRLFEILRENKIISRSDLKQLLGFSDRWRWKVLSRALRKFERIGVLKRVRALSQYANTMKRYHPCVMLVRDPSEKDMEMFHDFGISIYSGMEENNHAEFEEDAEAEDTTREPSSSGNITAVKNEQDVEMSGRVLPIWTPDRNIHNQLFDVIDQTGTAGATNSEVIRACFGVFYRRPLENTLARLVECWQLSQPPHLRHLAIVRDTALQRTITHYVHYSARNFGKIVDAGESSWEAVEFVPRNTKSGSIKVPPIDVKPQLDPYGLPPDAPVSELVKNGDSSLMDCMLVVRPNNYLFSSSDPRAIILEDGTYSIHYGIKDPRAPEGRSFQSSAGRRAIPDSPTWLKIEDNGTESMDMPAKDPRRKSKGNSINFQGMTEKEKLEALGMDETWTEYSVLLLERPSPGVYVTPRGRRRPAGRRQGRPRISRVAVFKSPKLQALPWFATGVDRPDTVELDSRFSQAPNTDEDFSVVATRNSGELGSAQGASGTRGTKRAAQGRVSGPEPEDILQRASKLRRVRHDSEGSQEERSGEGALREEDAMDTHASEPQLPSPKLGKRKRAPSLEPGQAELRLRKRAEKTSKAEAEDANRDNLLTADVDVQLPIFEPVPEPPATGPPIPRNTPVENNVPPEAYSSIQRKAASSAPTNGGLGTEISTPATPLDDTMSNVSPTPEVSSVKAIRSKLTDKGGSVSFLRRKIVLDIVETAGGAFPMGSELWYPFMTAWMKTKYREKPDMRTLKSAVKHLVDAGKLRQQTFCGKDYKGIMVTKTLICKPEIPPNDPVIKEMQSSILASDARYYFPPCVEIDPKLTKQGLTPKAPRQIPDIPVEPSLTVQLHQKPAAVVALEKRKGQNFQRKILRRLENENTRESMQEMRPSGVIRLLSIQRPDTQMPSMHNLISSFGEEQARARTSMGNAGTRQPKRLRSPISLIASYSMLMDPKQSFHPGSGTFSTDAGLAALMLNRATSPQPRPTQRRHPHLPQSLDDLFTQTRKRTVTIPGETDPRSRRFFRENNRILRWELQNEELLQQRSENLLYINQGIQESFESAPIEGGIRFDVGQTEKTAPPTVRTREQARISPFIHFEHPPIPPPPPPSVQPKTALEGYPIAPRPPLPPANTPFRASPIPQHRRIEKLNDSTNAGSDLTTSSQSRQPARRNRLTQQLPRSMHQKLMTAIVAVRALAGGSDGRLVDWALVCRCFPEQDSKFIQDKGKSILGKNRLQIAKMQSDFQERFIEAYSNDEVPPINYDDLDGYDWNAVISWANAELDVPKSEKVPDLPATRDQFDNIFELREEPMGSQDEFYQSQAVTIYRKRSLISSVAFATPLPPKRHPRKNFDPSRFDTVKTWIRANTLTPAEVYRSADAKDALSYIDGGLLSNALQSLVTERVISQSNKGRFIPGRNYDITEHFLFTLSKRRPIELTELRRAATFKTTILDSALAQQGVYEVSYSAEDGDILALINLFSKGRITLLPHDPPRDKFGLTDGGYLTRMMNKEKLRFAVDVYPVRDRYIRGNPISEKTSAHPPPCPARVRINDTVSVPEKIPLWFDIHGGLIQVLWDRAVTAVLGCVAMRPGITTAGIAGMIRPTMGAWEVQILLEWLVEIGVMRQGGGGPTDADEPGWSVQEWWWMVPS
ncbi:putative TFIIIC transcription initiation factor complex subunits Tfc3 [Aspergillus lucknowensis]|uniref:TFIIIC transcription initiation factor complex subunits Tfc3 n=1 Tax=Aspergillus lucknowensis TaxID=176173 RepID=A0ABR4LJ19_9EURO